MGLRYMNSPKTARLGNYVSIGGMTIALVATGIALDWSSGWWIALIGLGLGAGVGIYFARSVKMTAMPQMVAIFNGAGGGAAAMVATAEFLKLDPEHRSAYPSISRSRAYSRASSVRSASRARSSRSSNCKR